MNEMIRATIHDALEVQEPAGLRSRVIASVPMERPRLRRWHIPGPGSQWATAFAAILLTAALIAGLVYSRLSPMSSVQHGPGPGLRLSNPSGIAFAPDGTLYVADYTSNRIFRVQNNGTLVTVAGGGLNYEGKATAANLFGPVGLGFDSRGALFIAENPGARVSRLDPNGTLSTVYSWHSAGFPNEPWGLAVSPAGWPYASFGGQVNAIDPVARTAYPIDLSSVRPPVAWPGFLAFDSAGNLYVSDMAPVVSSLQETPPPPGGCRILRISPGASITVVAGTGKCGYSGDGGPATSAELNDPQGIAFDAAGNLYFADASNLRIRRIDPHGVITTVAITSAATSSTPQTATSVTASGKPSGVAISAAGVLYFAEDGPFNASGEVRVIDLRTGKIRTVVDSYSRVVS